jgi:hypothetical protein
MQPLEKYRGSRKINNLRVLVSGIAKLEWISSQTCRSRDCTVRHTPNFDFKREGAADDPVLQAELDAPFTAASEAVQCRSSIPCTEIVI